jgi:hypothetical protein
VADELARVLMTVLLDERHLVPGQALAPGFLQARLQALGCATGYFMGALGGPHAPDLPAAFNAAFARGFAGGARPRLAN